MVLGKATSREVLAVEARGRGDNVISLETEDLCEPCPGHRVRSGGKEA